MGFLANYTGQPSFVEAVSVADARAGALTTGAAFSESAALAALSDGAIVSGGAGGNIIDADRRIDWSLAGVEGDIVNRSTVHSTVSAYTGTAGAINAALANASSAGGNNVVKLGAGTFNLSTTLFHKYPNVTLRGTVSGGVLQTTVRFTNTGGSGFYWGGGSVAILMGAPSIDVSRDAFDPSWTGAAVAKTRTWTGCGGVANSYPKGGTVLNLASAPTGLAVGDMLLLWQTDDADGTVPRTGYMISSKTDHAGSPSKSGACWQGSGQTQTSACQQRVRVVGVSGSNVTIWPGVFLPHDTWRSGNTPKVSWQDSQLTGAGVEDLIINTNSAGAQWAAVQFWFAANCWLTRCAIIPPFGTIGSGGFIDFVVSMMESRNLTVRSNWISKAQGGGSSTFTSYGVSYHQCSHCLVENNIFDQCESPMIFLASASGNVNAYNYEITGSGQEGGVQFHDVGVSMSLVEGNRCKKLQGDGFHGPSQFTTAFRNWTEAMGDANIDAWSYSRFWNCVGNVHSASAGYKTLITDGTLHDRFSGWAYRLGYNNQSNTTDSWWNGLPNIGVDIDAEVYTSMMIWGNYTAVDTTTRFNASEVPTADTHYPNATPADQILPSSMYRSSIPSWFTVSGFGTVQWPPIGSDVTGGASVSGKVHRLPCERAYAAAGGVITSFSPSLYG